MSLENRTRRQDTQTAGSVFFLVLALLTAVFSGLPDNPDAEVEFQTVRSLAQRGTLAIGGTPAAERILAEEFNVVRGEGGRSDERFAWFGIGQVLTGLPFYALGRCLAGLFPAIEDMDTRSTSMGVSHSEYFEHRAAGWRNPLWTAFSAWLIVWTARRMGVGRRSAWIAGLSYGTTTFALAQGRSTLSDVQATALLFAAFAELVRIRDGFNWLRFPRRSSLVGLGAALGGAFLTRIAVAPAVLVLFIAATFLLCKGSARLSPLPGASVRAFGAMFSWFIAPMVLCLMLFFGLNLVRFGSPFETGYGAVLRSGSYFSYPPHLGLAGLLISPGRGLIWMAPGVLLLPFGLRWARRKGERLWPFVLLALSLALIAPVAFTQGWHGGYTYGPRYLLPLLPFLWLGVAMALEPDNRRAPLWLVAALLALGLIVQVPSALVDHMTHQDLAAQAARQRWPEPGGSSPRERDEARFLLIQWNWAFAAPWAHWRILRHRAAGLPEDFPVRELFFMNSDERVRPGEERHRGWRHLAWVDFSQRLGGPLFVPSLLIAAMAVWGTFLGLRGLRPGTQLVHNPTR